MLSGHRCLRGPDCLPITDGSHKPGFPSGVRRMAQASAEGARGRGATNWTTSL